MSQTTPSSNVGISCISTVNTVAKNTMIVVEEMDEMVPADPETYQLKIEHAFPYSIEMHMALMCHRILSFQYYLHHSTMMHAAFDYLMALD